MKWIGQHIYDQISRFRDDVYLEDLSATSETDILVVDSIGKVSKNTTAIGIVKGGTGRTSFTDGGILIGNGTGGVIATDVLADGEILIGDGTTDPSVLDVGSSTAITTLGTIATGVWNGTAIASAYLDADTAHLTTAQTFTGSKTMGTDVKLNFRDANSYIYSPTANDLEVVATDITLDASNAIALEQDTDITGNLTVTGLAMAIASSTTAKPLLQIRNTTNDATSGSLQFYSEREAPAVNGDDIGSIDFWGENDAEQIINYAKIVVDASEVDDTDEAGKMSFFVAESNGTTSQLTAGLVLEGEHATDGEVDVTIGAGTASTTTVAGNLQVTTGIELGHATDTTLARSASGKVTIEGNQIVTDGSINVASEASAPIAMRVARRTLTQAEMNDLHNTSIEIIPAPGANKIIILNMGGSYVMADRAATNTATSTLGIGFDGFTESFSTLYARRFMLNVTTDILWNLNSYLGNSATVLTDAVNKKVEATFFGGCTNNCFTSVDVILSYYILDLS